MSRIFEYSQSFNEISVAELFNENTKLHPDVPGDYDPEHEYSIDEIRAMTSTGRNYRGTKKLRCMPSDSNGSDFSETIVKRRTIRAISRESLSLSSLSRLLVDTNGITGETDIAGKKMSLRACPSAGALYPVELYILCNNVEGATRGLYHFNPLTLELCLLDSEYSPDVLMRICCGQPQAKIVPAVVVFTAVLQRPLRKYGSRGYRYALLEIGHAAQNLLLSCAANGLACMTTGGFYDDQLNHLLRVDGLDETAMYVAFIGHTG